MPSHCGEHDFGVTARPEGVVGFPAQLPVVEDLTVERQDVPVGSLHRLRRTGKINDGQPGVCNTHRSVDEKPLIVGPRCARARITARASSSIRCASKRRIPAIPHISPSPFDRGSRGACRHWRARAADH